MPKVIGTPAVRFNLEPKKDVPNESYVFLFFRYKYKGKSIRLKYSVSAIVDPQYWDDKSARPIFNRKHPEYAGLKRRMNRLEDIVIAIYKEHDNGNIPLKEFKNEIAYRIGDKERPAEETAPALFEFIEQFIIHQQSKQGAKRGTWKKYITVLHHLQDFEDEKNIDLDYDSIDWKFRNEFINWLYEPPRNHSTNNAAKIMSVLKLFLEESRKLKYHNNLTYTEKGFGVKRVKTKNKVKLSLDELDALLDLDLSDNRRLERVRDLFIVGAFSGQRFSDWHKITKDQIFTNDEGAEMIRIMAEKTTKYTPIPLLPELKQILEKYDYKLPSISIQKFNVFIKEVCKIALGDVKFIRIYSEAGQTKEQTIQKWQKVSSHAARRSFVSNFLQLGIEPLLIRTITGHATEAQLYEYADIEADELAARFAKKAAIALQEHRNKNAL